MTRLLIAAGCWWLATAGASVAAPRAVSLDQCADQYVLALSPREAVAGLSYRAGDGDSYMAAQAKGLPRRRATLESLLAANPQVALRYWGGDARLTVRLQAHGVKVVTLNDANDFNGIRDNIRLAAQALDNPAEGEALIAGMDRRLARAASFPGHGQVAYMTPGGATAGPGTFVDEMIRVAGLTNLETRPGYRLLSLERIALAPPQALVLGFFDAFAVTRTWWSPVRNGVLARATRDRATVRLPGAILDCPGWFAAEGVTALSRVGGT